MRNSLYTNCRTLGQVKGQSLEVLLCDSDCIEPFHPLMPLRPAVGMDTKRFNNDKNHNVLIVMLNKCTAWIQFPTRMKTSHQSINSQPGKV